MKYEKIIEEVKSLLNKNDGHGFDHVFRVRDLAKKFAEQEKADKNIVELACLLHDVDDYKIFGEKNAKNLLNANRILKENFVSEEVCRQVLEIIKSMGYGNYLAGIRPATIEVKIVSDADMCDAMGSEGILRTYAFSTVKGAIFFDKSISPLKTEKLANKYHNNIAKHAVQHFFDKLLVISSILITKAGKEEGAKRQQIMVDFLFELFREENALEWTNHLDNFLKKIQIKILT